MAKLDFSSFFIPREEKFFKILNDQASNTLNGVICFQEFVYKFQNLSQAQKEEYLKRIEEHEHRGDDITHFLMDRLNRVFITPIDKEDLHQLTVLLDDVLDLIYASAKQIVGYKLKKVDKHIIKMTDIIKEGMEETTHATKNLKLIKYSKQSSIKINQLENDADEVYHNAMTELFSNSMDSIEVIKLKDIYFNLELICDKLEALSNVMQNIVIKHA